MGFPHLLYKCLQRYVTSVVWRTGQLQCMKFPSKQLITRICITGRKRKEVLPCQQSLVHLEHCFIICLSKWTPLEKTWRFHEQGYCMSMPTLQSKSWRSKVGVMLGTRHREMSPRDAGKKRGQIASVADDKVWRKCRATLINYLLYHWPLFADVWLVTCSRKMSSSCFLQMKWDVTYAVKERKFQVAI